MQKFMQKKRRRDGLTDRQTDQPKTIRPNLSMWGHNKEDMLFYQHLLLCSICLQTFLKETLDFESHLFPFLQFHQFGLVQSLL